MTSEIFIKIRNKLLTNFYFYDIIKSPNKDEVLKMKHKAIRVDNLMYKGCEPHWKCTLCGDTVPFHCYTKEEFENRCCSCHKINCNDCDHLTEKGGGE